MWSSIISNQMIMLFSLFNNHFTFYLSYLGMNYSNVIGYLLFIVFMLQFGSGILLSTFYSSLSAFHSVSFLIMNDILSGIFIRQFHLIGSSGFMILLLFHAVRGFWLRSKVIISSSFRLNLIWVTGALILLCSLIAGFLGYILNWGQMSYWGITVIINLLSIIPLFGSYIGEYPWCSSIVIVNRIYIIHFSLGFIIGCIILVHITLLHTFSSFNPLINKNSIIIPFYALFFKDCFVSYVIPLFTSFYLFWEPDIFGNCDNLIIANPLSTPNHILPEWYSLIFYCLLRAVPNKTMGVIIVLLFVLLVFYNLA
jgi:quinol-cytochrome oxidoreductase complex cytochrome b subunit